MSAFHVQTALSALRRAWERLASEDPDLLRDEPAIADALSQDIAETREAALDAVARCVRAALWAEAQEKAAKARAAEIEARAARYGARAGNLRGVAFAAMDALAERRLEAGDFTATIAAGRPAVRLTDPALLPAELWRVKREPRLSDIKARLTAGEMVPGAELSNGAPALTVRKT